MLTPRPRTILALTLAAAAPALIAAQQRGRADNPFPGGANPDGSLRPTRAADAAVHAGRLHRVRDPQAGQRGVPDQVPARGDARRRDRAGQRDARRQRRVRRRGLRSAHRQAAEVHLSAGRQRSREPRDPRQAADSGAARRRRPRADLQDLQGSAHLHDARRRHRLGAEPERLPARRAAAERLRVHLVQRRRAADDDGRTGS